MQCRICHNPNPKEVLSLGTTPLANSFLTEKELNDEEPQFPLELLFCDNCKLLQLSYVVPPETMFSNYLYVTSTTRTFQEHFALMARQITRKYGLTESSLAVDIGSNDGLLLKGFRALGVKTIGVEPAANLAKMAEDGGIETINDFFNEKTASEIIRRKGNADVATATNVFAHINNITDFTKNLKRLLKKDGIFVIEAPYAADMLEKMTFDAIYHEHLSYFALTPLDCFFRQHGMEIFDVQRTEPHGGSIRVFAKKQGGKHNNTGAAKKMLQEEKEKGLASPETYKKFAEKVYDARKSLVDELKKIKSRGKTIAGYGAPAKSTTLLNFCGIGNDIIDYIVDDNPLKAGRYTPGTHIPVVSQKKLEEKKPDYILILAWNFAKEIMEKTGKYKEAGVKYIIPLPEPKVI